jgi:hypothetical protein
MSRDTLRVVIKGDKFTVAQCMASVGIPFVFVREAGPNTVGVVPAQHLDALVVLLEANPALQGRYAKSEGV